MPEATPNASKRLCLSLEWKAPFHAQMCDHMQDSKHPEPVKSLLQRSQDFQKRVSEEITGENDAHPDVMLKLGDTMLPRHRLWLSESSEYFKAMFQARMMHMAYVCPACEMHARDVTQCRHNINLRRNCYDDHNSFMSMTTRAACQGAYWHQGFLACSPSC